MADKGFQGIVVIHSPHEEGAAAMKKYLPEAKLAPFGDFEVAIGGIGAGARPWHLGRIIRGAMGNKDEAIEKLQEALEAAAVLRDWIRQRRRTPDS